MSDLFDDYWLGPIVTLNRHIQRLTPTNVGPLNRPWLDVTPTALTSTKASLHYPGDSTKNLLCVPFAATPTGGDLYWPVRTTEERKLHYWDTEGKSVGSGGRAFGWKRGGKKPDRLHAAMDLSGKHHDVVVAIARGKILKFRKFYEGVWHCLVDHTDTLGCVINYGEIEASRFCKRSKNVEAEKKDKDGKLVTYVKFKKCPGSRCRKHCKGTHANRYVMHDKEVHRVGKDETLQTIADSFHGVTLDTLKTANPELSETPKRRTKVTIPAVLKVGDTVEAGEPLGEIGRMKSDSMLHLETYASGIEETHSWWYGEHGMKTALSKWKADKSEDKAAYKKWAEKTGLKAWEKSPNRVGGSGTVGKATEIYLDPTNLLIYLAKNGK